MKSFLLLLFLLVSVGAYAQLDQSSGVTRLEGLERVEEETPEGETKEFESNFQLQKTHSLSNLNMGFTPRPSPRRFSSDEPKGFSMTNKDAGFIRRTIDYEPGYLKKRDSEMNSAPKGNQDLGSLRTPSEIVTIMYRDHEYVDGDRVRVFANGDIIAPNVVLSGGWKGVSYKLNTGINRIAFEALNMGTSGPNTAAFQILDEKGELLTTNQWNLSTGSRGNLVIVREEQ